MASVFEKLNLKTQRSILIVNAPPEFEPAIAALDGVAIVRELRDGATFEFALAFASVQSEVDRLSPLLVSGLEGHDPLLWLAYPKGSSKRYRCDFNRDTGWGVLRDLGFDTVRQVAIDADWSALRFRRVEQIKSIRR